MAAMELTTVFRHRVTTTECARSNVDVGVQTSEQTNAITRLEGRPTLHNQLSRRFSLGAQSVGSFKIWRTL